ncbi:MAG: hypothetical protein WD873_06565, partial [Candidatus Hydrogenedentales bacterium]
IDAWIRAGGTAIYPSFPRGPMTTVEGDAATFQRWQSGDTGDGTFHRFTGDMEPPSLYGDYVRDVLLDLDNLDPHTAEVLRIARPERVFFTVQEDGHLLALNYRDETIDIIVDGEIHTLPPYRIRRIGPLR